MEQTSLPLLVSLPSANQFHEIRALQSFAAALLSLHIAGHFKGKCRANVQY